MALILFDSNIFVDLFHGVHEAAVELGQYDHPAISIITFMELRAGIAVRPHEAPILDALLAEFEVLPLDQQVTEMAIEIRGNSLVAGHKVKLPDAIIGATARAYSIPLVTRNPKDFNGNGIVVHVPYDYDSQTGLVSNVRPAFETFAPPPSLTRIR